jgi:hypothetical protein
MKTDIFESSIFLFILEKFTNFKDYKTILLSTLGLPDGNPGDI